MPNPLAIPQGDPNPPVVPGPNGGYSSAGTMQGLDAVTNTLVDRGAGLINNPLLAGGNPVLTGLHMATSPNLGMPVQPPGVGSQGAPAAPLASPEEMQAALGHMKVITDGLLGLVSKAPGELTHKDVLSAGADMLKNPAFSNPDARNALLNELLQMPQDEGALRQVLGQHLLHSVAVQQAAQAQMGGTPDAGPPQ